MIDITSNNKRGAVAPLFCDLSTSVPPPSDPLHVVYTTPQKRIPFVCPRISPLS